MRRLAGKVALITGGGGGIGEATARLFSEEGASVALVDTNVEDVQEVAGKIEADGGQALALTANIASEPEAGKIVSDTVKRFGRLHILANVAAVRIPPGDVTEIPAASWEYVYGVNVMGVVHCSKYAVPEIARAGGGSIIHVSSTGAQGARSGWAPYDSSKAALLSLTRDMACDHVHQDIRVNAICPGPTLTKFHIRNYARSEGISFDEAETRMRALGGATLMGRQANPREIAHGLLFLASDEASFVTGAIINIDGGMPDAQPSVPPPPPQALTRYRSSLRSTK